MRKVQGIEDFTVLREQELSAETVLVGFALELTIQAKGAQPLVSYQVEDPDFSVIALGQVERAIVAPDADAQKNALRISV